MALDDKQLKQRIDEVGSVESVMQEGVTPDFIEDPVTRVLWREAYSQWVSFTPKRDVIIEHLTPDKDGSINFHQGYSV